jgi:hypothetical protein
MDLGGVSAHLTDELLHQGWMPVSTKATPSNWQSRWTFVHPKYGTCSGSLELSRLADDSGFEATLSAEREAIDANERGP